MNSVFILSGLGIFSLTAEIFNLRRLLYPVVLLGLIASAGFVVTDWNSSSYYFHNMLLFDNSAIAFSVVISIVALFWVVMSYDFLKINTHVTDHFSLILFSLVGAVFMVSYHNMVMLFLGIEILSIPLYVLAGSRMKNVLSNEAAFKYFLMGAFATGILLFGIALVYGATGQFDITQIAAAIGGGKVEFEALLYIGILMILVGLSFKASAAPFHFWAPDVYQGAPTVVTAFMSTIVKIAAFAAFFRLFYMCFSGVSEKWISVVYVLAIVTLILSNVTAVFQRNVKRMFAYSSIAHAGYLMIAMMLLNEATVYTILFYVSAYSVSTLGAFSVLHAVEDENEQATFETFNGLAKRNPFLAFVMSVSVLSLAGIPPLAGFFAKYMIFTGALSEGHTGLVLLAVVASLIGVYYYFQLIISMYFREAGFQNKIAVPVASQILMILLVVTSILLGVFPDLILSL